MMILSVSIVVLLNILGLVLTNPIQQQQQSINTKSETKSLEQAFRTAEEILNRYYYLMSSDTEHLVHGMLHLLMNNPTSFPYVPNRAMSIAFKSIEQKLGEKEVELLAKPLLLAVEQNYLNKSKSPPPVKLSEETKEKIEEALDKFFDEADFDAHM